MGCARKLVFSWGGNPGVGSLHRFRDAVEHGWPSAARDRGAQPRRHGQPRTPPARPELPFARAARLPRHRSRRRESEHRLDRRARSPASRSLRCRRCGPTSPSSTRSGPTVQGNVQLWGIVGVQKEAVLAARRSLVTVEEVVRRARSRGPARSSCRRWTVTRRRGRSRRRAPVVRARLLRARQRLLRRLGRDQPRPRAFLPGWSSTSSDADVAEHREPARRGRDERRRRYYTPTR